ncbi:uncharacterized protein [Montipora capricornis]|uniref:uncharacterized protein n=1 Tax=Montipora capricornis TaxID=246305 RepID=UPI0035F11F4A
MKIDLLIGSDYIWNFFDGSTIRGEESAESGPVAVSTTFGWVLSGPVINLPKEKLSSIQFSSTHVLRVDSSSNDTLYEDFEKLWDLDSIGIREKDTVHEAFEKIVSFQDGKYSVHLPWKEHHKLLPDNYENSVARLSSQLKQLRRDPEVLREYNSIIEDQLQSGIIERVDTTECPAVGKVHYLPHHAVVRRDALTARIVFDASSRATSEDPSLNECLYSGPALTPNIFKILLRFRERKIALVGDIEKAFLNIKVQEQDRNVLRFLWIDSLEKVDPELVLYRFCRVVFGVKSMSGERNLERCLLLYEKSKKCLSPGGFNLWKWISNSPQLLELIREDRTRTKENCPETQPVVEDTETYVRVAVRHLEQLDMKNEYKVLGLNWNCVFDEFIFKFEALLRLAENLETTRRSLLKITSSFFDPLGILSPVLVQMKLLFQMLCQGNIAWDAPLPEPVRRQWKGWLQDLREVEQIMIPRCLYDGVEEVVTSYTLHGFGDASENVYCAVAYLVLETSSGNYPVLLTSKTRVAPLAKQSMPRLELLSGVILARLASSVKEALQSQVQIDKTYLWVRQQDCNLLDQGIEGVEAVCSEPYIGPRGESAFKLKGNRLWWKGPSWLSEPVSSWPKSKVCHQPPTEERLMEQKKEQLKRYSAKDCCDKLFRVTAQVQRFVRNLKIKAKLLKKGTVRHGEVTEEEIAHAELQWLRSVQKNLKSQANYSHLEYEFGLYEDENGIVRCKGRIANADLPYETRFPVLLPRDNHISTLLVRQAHEREHHSKVVATQAQLRMRFWIVRGRQFVKKITSRCTVCRRYEGRGFKVPPPPDLPEFRLSQKPAFTYVGVDYTGPLYIREPNCSTTKKVYILLFTCCSTRAVHQELATDLSADVFIRCLRRFTARRGLPEIIVSDNAKTFKSAAKALQKVFSYPSVKRFLANRRISWKFNMDRAPRWGGFLERMIQNVKQSLRKTQRNAKLDYDELHTILVEVEGTLNSRPLTFVSSDDDEEPLTPFHLIYGRGILSLPDVTRNREDSLIQVGSSDDMPRR